MQCPQCRHPHAQGAKFCAECGTALPRQCANCGHALAALAKFCSECGAPTQGAAPAVAAPAVVPSSLVPAQPPQQPARNVWAAPDTATADRRQAAVLFADITGYTALCASADPEQIQEMLGRFFDAMDGVVESHGGRVLDRAGDAVMAVFGAPVAHGNDAQRALHAALAMHGAAAGVPDCHGVPLRLHIGIAKGEVVAAVISGGGKAKYSVTGDAVNLAARLDALAQAGETLISDALYREVAASVEVEAAGSQVVKGFGAPMELWRVLRLRQARGERMPFVGRHAELGQLVGALDAVRETGAGATVLVRGDAGIGKSRLVEEFQARARDMGFDTPSGQVLDFGVGKGQDAISTLLKAMLQVGAPDDEGQRSAALQAAIARGLVTDAEVMFVNEWLGLPQPKPLEAIFEAMDNATRQRRAGEALGALLQRAAAARPQLVLIEDLHWASPELLRLVAAITLAAARAPMILLLTSRIEGDPIDKAWRASIHGSAFMTIDLAPLRPQEARLLAGGLVEATSRFALMCIERAEGNPLFLEQLLRTARAGETPGLLPSVPPTIQSLVLERMDRLAAPDRTALQAAAVIGKRFSLANLRGVAGVPDARCDVLVAADIVRPDGPDFLFAHALIQEAVYASTLKSRRRELHLAAARWFDTDDPLLQAEHLDRAEDATAAAAYLRAAAQEAARLRFESALRLAERGGTVAADPARGNAAVGCELALLCGEMLREIGRSTESIAAFQRALELAGDDLLRCRALMGIAAGYRVTGEFVAAMHALGEARPMAERLGLTIERSRIHHTQGNLYFAQGRIAECDAEHLLALQLAEQCADPESQARALSGLGDARYAQGRMSSALDYFRRCVALCDEDQIRTTGPNRCMIGHCLWYANQLPAAVAEARSVCEDAQRFGIVSVLVFAHASLTQLLTESGSLQEATASAEKSLALARLAGSRRYEATVLSFSADHSLRRGDRAQARRDLDLALELARQTGLGFIGAALEGALARVADSAEERVAHLAEGEALLLQTGIAHNYLWFYRSAMEACLAARDWPRALHYADLLEQKFQVEPLPWVALMVERARAIIAAAKSGHDAAAIARLQAVRAAAVAAGNGWVLAGIDHALAN
ncbi:adenylate/guanylate cyclase domain-containing protein [Variovorax sp. dw_308]|uniref:adenylate/guanylate cyclase domain-containing protein n=1 Tax=Variovorax sp. dw_308 TaxID=2721546 RepID=UPI001C457DD0|nr:adenylate/guanylate cyclase domain-containing protein [Variovorax sp. dw_308]